MKDQRQGAEAPTAGATPTAAARDIASRAVDPTPLTAKEVFPESNITIPGTPQPYQVVKTEATADCGIAAEGDLRKLISDQKCSQVVRATLRSPTKEYLITAGALNLETAEGAQRVKDQTQSMVDQSTGRFVGFVAGKGTEPLAQASTHAGWDAFGHYVVYCVVVRANGQEFEENDPYVRQILYDVAELHLRDTVLAKRAAHRSGAGG